MSIQAIIFICAIALIAYAYIGYPLIVWFLAKIAPRPLLKTADVPSKLSIVIAAYNEAGSIQRRIRELLGMLQSTGSGSEIVVVSDGSTDGTDRLAAEIADPRVRVIQHPSNMGKAVALNTGAAAVRNEIVIFADARQQWSVDAIERMIENFADPRVGAVGGDLVLRKEDGSLEGVGLYWKLEKWIRRNESTLHSSVQVAGAICAVRRGLYRPLPRGMILDDVCWPLGVIMSGYRVIHEPRAQAFDRLPQKAGDEMRRKVRTLSGNLQLLCRMPCIVVPFVNPMWFSVISHKLLRLVVPWAMIVALVASAAAPEPLVRIIFLAQLAAYVLGILGMFWPRMARGRLVSALASLLVLNAAAFMSWFVYFSGRSERSWKKAAYAGPASPLTAG